MEKSQKAAEDNTEMLQNLLIGIENMGDNLKQFRKEMESWKTTELQNTEKEFEETEQQNAGGSIPFCTGYIRACKCISCSCWSKT